MEQLTLSLEEVRAKASPSLENSRDSTTPEADWLSLMSDFCAKFGLDGSSGKTCRESCQLTGGQTLSASSKRLLKSGISVRGAYLTLNTSERTAFPAQSPNGADVCLLSDILIRGDAPQRYFLSAKACRGIIRRAEAKGKQLPELLLTALKEQIQEAEEGGGQTLGIDRAAFNQGKNAKYNFSITEEMASTLTAKGPSAVCTVLDMTHADDVIRDCGKTVPTLQARMGTGGNQVPLVLKGAIPLDYGHSPKASNIGHGEDGDPMFTLTTICDRTKGVFEFDKTCDRGLVMYESKLRMGQMSETDVCQTLAAHMDNQTDLPLIVSENCRGSVNLYKTSNCLTTGGGKPCQGYAAALCLQENGTDRSVTEEKSPPLRTSVVPALCIRENTIGRQPQNGGNDVGIQEELAYTLTTAGAHGVATKARVRRLTPVECERLMGFPSDWTKVPFRGKPADQCPDAPRYKACGNSMCVNVMQWIGERIEMVERGEL